MSDSSTDPRATPAAPPRSQSTPPPAAGPTDMGPTLTPAPTTPFRPIPGALPERIGRYRILRLLGKGGMGTVYLAEDTQLQRQVALKVPHFAEDESPAILERFYREARTAARLQHANICPVFDVDQVDGTHYLTMAFIEGETLSVSAPGYCKRSASDAAALIRKLALALDEAHRQGIIHRDLKPSNIMLNRHGEPIVMDFGLAREIKAATSDLSTPGMVMGTPAYMAPEQARGDSAAIGPGCDVYSLGIILYQLLLGRVPFEGGTMDVIARHLRDEPPPPASLRPGLDASIAAICLKAMAKEPSLRFLSMAEFAQTLDEYIKGQLTTARCSILSEDDPFQRAVAEGLVLLRTWGSRHGAHRLATCLGRRKDTQADPRFALLLRVLSGDGTAFVQAKEELCGVRQLAALLGWARIARLYHLNQAHDFEQVEVDLAKVRAEADPRDNILQAEISFQEGYYLYNVGKLDDSLTALHRALDLCGREHFLTGSILELLGKVYARQDNFHAAEEFFRLAMSCKEKCNDALGRIHARTELGRLHLAWGDLDRAEEYFQQNLLETPKHGDARGKAVTLDFLGLVALKRGERAAANGRKAVALKHYHEAEELLDASIRGHKKNEFLVDEGYAHKERARIALALDDLDTAERHLKEAQTLFEKTRFEEGLAFVRSVWGVVHRQRDNHTEAINALRQALAYFDRTANNSCAAQTQFEIARTLVAAGEVRQLCTHEFIDALKRAEKCRRAGFVERIEEELRAVDEQAHWRHVFHRTRGRFASPETGSLEDGETETATVLFLNLVGFIPFCQGLDAAEVMRTLNQLLADLSEVLEQQRGFVTSYLGGGFMALFRGGSHAVRSVEAALELIRVVCGFNRPRAVLGLRQLPVRIGVASGSMFLGNIGTYHKMDFTAVGIPVNLSARLMRQADPRYPCVSQYTSELVRERFEFAPGNPRVLDLPGIGTKEVWDVIGRKSPGK